MSHPMTIRMLYGGREDDREEIANNSKNGPKQKQNKQTKETRDDRLAPPQRPSSVIASSSLGYCVEKQPPAEPRKEIVS